jgi:hypothetical protein
MPSPEHDKPLKALTVQQRGAARCKLLPLAASPKTARKCNEDMCVWVAALMVR